MRNQVRTQVRPRCSRKILPKDESTHFHLRIPTGYVLSFSCLTFRIYLKWLEFYQAQRDVITILNMQIFVLSFKYYNIWYRFVGNTLHRMKLNTSQIYLFKKCKNYSISFAYLSRMNIEYERCWGFIVDFSDVSN